MRRSVFFKKGTLFLGFIAVLSMLSLLACDEASKLLGAFEISGTIKDTNGAAIEGATVDVYLMSQNTDKVKNVSGKGGADSRPVVDLKALMASGKKATSVTTDAEGKYKAGDLTPDLYIVVASKKDYAAAVKGMDPETGELNQNSALQPPDLTNPTAVSGVDMVLAGGPIPAEEIQDDGTSTETEPTPEPEPLEEEPSSPNGGSLAEESEPLPTQGELEEPVDAATPHWVKLVVLKNAPAEDGTYAAEDVLGVMVDESAGPAASIPVNLFFAADQWQTLGRVYVAGEYSDTAITKATLYLQYGVEECKTFDENYPTPEMGVYHLDIDGGKIFSDRGYYQTLPLVPGMNQKFVIDADEDLNNGVGSTQTVEFYGDCYPSVPLYISIQWAKPSVDVNLHAWDTASEEHCDYVNPDTSFATFLLDDPDAYGPEAIVIKEGYTGKVRVRANLFTALRSVLPMKSTARILLTRTVDGKSVLSDTSVDVEFAYSEEGTWADIGEFDFTPPEPPAPPEPTTAESIDDFEDVSDITNNADWIAFRDEHGVAEFIGGTPYSEVRTFEISGQYKVLKDPYGESKAGSEPTCTYRFCFTLNTDGTATMLSKGKWGKNGKPWFAEAHGFYTVQNPADVSEGAEPKVTVHMLSEVDQGVCSITYDLVFTGSLSASGDINMGLDASGARVASQIDAGEGFWVLIIASKDCQAYEKGFWNHDAIYGEGSDSECSYGKDDMPNP